jgi:ribosomal protein L20
MLNVLLRNTLRPPFSDNYGIMKASDTKRQSRNIVGKRVKEARQAYDPSLTQDQLSGKLAKAGVQLDRVAIAKIEVGIRCAFDFEVKALAAVLKVDANWLLGIDGRSPTARKNK